MTRQKHLKARVRARMDRTGERYAVARARVSGTDSPPPDGTSVTVAGIRHFAGANPATTALRIALTAAGVRDPAGAPLSEGLTLIIGGGIGAGVYAFRYEREDVSTLFLGGRHRWDDDLTFIDGAARRLGLAIVVSETGSRTVALRDLRDALERGPAITWVDLATLGTRGLPREWEGGGYHVVTVYDLDEAGGSATIGDLASQPFPVTLDDLARARARIVKQRNRILTLDGGQSRDVVDAIYEGLRAGIDDLTNPRRRNLGLGAFGDLATRIRSSTGRESWAHVFPRGRQLYEALRSIHRFVEGYGSGGGLVRPLFASGLRDAARVTGDSRFLDPADRYGGLGRAWSDLASAALPDAVPLLAETRQLLMRQEALYRSRATGALPEIRATWQRSAELDDAVAHSFPLPDADTAALLADLADRLERIHQAEAEALDSLRTIAG